MEKLIYLGTLLTNKRRNTEEITRRSGMTKSANKNFAKPQHTNKHWNKETPDKVLYSLSLYMPQNTGQLISAESTLLRWHAGEGYSEYRTAKRTNQSKEIGIKNYFLNIINLNTIFEK